MPNIYHGELESYFASVITRWGDRTRQIVIVAENATVYLWFYAGSGPLPGNTSPVIGGQQHLYINMYADDYLSVIDLLRNEKPLRYFYRDDSKLFYISTRDEPIGEHELSQQ
ncbi:MAG: hypothetical protein GTN62_01215 [Gemmatimonadales bacterium]|nr:hypothetical protein [Gemmatimonadales bacterium]NIN12796.1 hypothetical protein [Gemmatimonadales bacterium]NIN48724.1 hypothetical protein [Gemmatimonadales bacterium]NIP06188.1 hypothetical protein [Gemmatimonadales bacterium]NIR01373.1 hypothetical protein [Gemmatimonadales bacterium]